MFKSILATCLLASCLALPSKTLSQTADGQNAQTAGISEGKLRAPHHGGRKMAYAVWYPAQAGSETRDFGGNAVWQPVQVAKDAPAQGGKYPVVLMSHGLGGHYKSLGWLATELAKAGAIVVSVNHPNSTFSDFDWQSGLAHWTRAADLTFALDQMLANPELGPLMDAGNVAAVGFSYGGWTALQLAGLRGNLAGFAQHCAAAPSGHCADIAKSGADLAALDGALWDGRYGDARITRAVAIDPGLTYGITATQTATMTAETLLIQLGQGADRLDSTDISPNGSGFAALLPQAKTLEIAPAYHFSVLPLCTENGAQILQDEKDDPVCTDPDGADRADVHARVIAATKTHLGLN